MAKVTEKLIKDMQVGEVGYTVCWAIYKVPNDLKLNAYTIRGDYDATSAPIGTCKVRIKKLKSGSVEVGVADLKEYDYRFGEASLDLDWNWMPVVSDNS